MREWTDAAEERCVELEAMAQVPRANSHDAQEEMTTIKVGYVVEISSYWVHMNNNSPM